MDRLDEVSLVAIHGVEQAVALGEEFAAEEGDWVEGRCCFDMPYILIGSTSFEYDDMRTTHLLPGSLQAVKIATTPNHREPPRAVSLYALDQCVKQRKSVPAARCSQRAGVVERIRFSIWDSL